MKIDENYIESIDSDFKDGLIDRKEAKNKLAEYAKESFNFDLNKQKSFDNMVVQLREYIENYEEEPTVDDGTGFTIGDLIEAADQKDGKSIFNEAKPEALELIDTLVHKGPTPEAVELPYKGEEVKIVPLTTQVTPIEQVKKENEPIIEEEKIQPAPPEAKYELPKDFSPTITLIGRSPGFYTLSWWIYKWILENKDWKERPESCPEYSAINILKSLIYFINRDGQVRIRETRNSSYAILK
ncbi:TPA: hypothetical protein ACOA2N_003412 [Vibrio cholerae]|nr:inhibitor of prohead protease [Providencia phage PSTRCR_121]UGO50236.1 putative inhibitor of prohead protease [Morganella phage vB_MmoM_Rgz1]